jgi:hypothetical protein
MADTWSFEPRSVSRRFPDGERLVAAANGSDASRRLSRRLDRVPSKASSVDFPRVNRKLSGGPCPSDTMPIVVADACPLFSPLNRSDSPRRRGGLSSSPPLRLTRADSLDKSSPSAELSGRKNLPRYAERRAPPRRRPLAHGPS